MSDEKGFDVTKHNLVPEHTILSEEEIDEIKEKYKIDLDQLPKLDSKDPVAQEIGAKEGDVVKVIRESTTAGKSEAYRLVV